MSILLMVTLLGLCVGILVPLVFSDERSVVKTVAGGAIGLLAGAGIGFALLYVAATVLLRR